MERQSPSIDLVATRHPQAFPRPMVGHVMLPSALVSVAARLLSAGVDVRLCDENINPFKPRENGIVGCNLAGAPSIPVVRGLQERTKSSDLTWILGGQVCDSLNTEEFSRCFGPNTFPAKAIARNLNIEPGSIPPAEKVSLAPAFTLIGDSDMRRYLRSEVPFHVSQGCSFRCTHCSADRGQEERYRDLDHIRTDLRYLRERADSLGIPEGIRVFMSNLDVFQNPEQIEAFADMVLEEFPTRPAFKFRGLSTFTSFLKMAKKHPDALIKVVRAGFYNAGFGLDGYGKNVWRETHKPIGSEKTCLDTLKACRDFGIHPEVLMVTGHVGIDTDESLSQAREFLSFLVHEHGVTPSPYVATPCIPGSDGWRDPQHSHIVGTVLENPWTFQALEFAAYATRLKGHDKDSAECVNAHFAAMCQLPRSTTRALHSLTPEMSAVKRRIVRAANFGRFERL